MDVGAPMDEPPPASPRRFPRPGRPRIAPALVAVLAPATLLGLYLLTVSFASTDAGPQPLDAAHASQLARLESRLVALEGAAPQTEAEPDPTFDGLEERLALGERAATDAQALNEDLARIDANLSLRLLELDRRIDLLVAGDGVVMETVEVVVALNYTRRTNQQYVAAATTKDQFLPWTCIQVFHAYGLPRPVQLDDEPTPLWCRLNQQFIR